MYEPIIELFYQQQRAEVENEIYKQVMSVGVSVDREELIRALKYDRDQYNAGYRDGVKAGKVASMKEAIAKLRWMSQGYDRDGGEPEYPLNEAYAYAIAADALEMMMGENTGGEI